jgi:hypothetical protein
MYKHKELQEVPLEENFPARIVSKDKGLGIVQHRECCNIPFKPPWILKG